MTNKELRALWRDTLRDMPALEQPYRIEALLMVCAAALVAIATKPA